MPPLNVDHLNLIIEHIKSDLNRLWMPAIGVKKGSRIATTERAEGLTEFGECGYACCLCGWSKLLATPRDAWESEWARGEHLQASPVMEGARLGLSELETARLFASASGTRAEQWNEVRRRLENIVQHRVAAGEESAKGVRI